MGTCCAQSRRPFCRQIGVLLLKNRLLKLRAPVLTIFEVVLPLAFLSILAGFYLISTTQSSNPTAYTSAGDVQRVRPVALLPWRMTVSNYVIAVLPQSSSPSLVAETDSLLNFISDNYPAANFSSLGGIGFGPSGSYVRSIYVPPLSSVVRRFADQSALEAYVRDANYGKRSFNNGTRIYAAIVLRGARPSLDYSIRMNASEVPSTTDDPVSTIALATDLSPVSAYLAPQIQTSGPPFASISGASALELAPRPGFLTLQLLVDRWALGTQSTLPVDSSKLTSALVRALGSETGFLADIGGLLSWFGALSSQDADNVTAAITAWMGLSERFAPQTVDLAPFPTPKLTVNTYNNAMIFVFDIIFVIGILLPVYSNIRAVVREREEKLREAMLIVGMSETALYTSWWITYTIIYAVIALFAMLFALSTLFQFSGPGYIFAWFFFFGASNAALAYLISVFFTSAKFAAAIGSIIYLASFMAKYAFTNLSKSSFGAKVAASLLSPCAFGLTSEVVFTLEGAGVGVTSSTADSQYRLFTFNAGIGMMIFDTVLYTILALYIEQILPSRLRGFGVPKPWYFPCTTRFWRRTLGFGSRLSSAMAKSGVSPTDQISHSAVSPLASSASVEPPDAELRDRAAAGRAVTVLSLRKEFKTPDGIKVAVSDASLTFYEGQISVLLGHNGAGKTTLISALSGLFPATSGSATGFGVDILEDVDALREELGLCPQYNIIYPELTAAEHLTLWAGFKGVPTSEVAAESFRMLQQVGLTEKRNSQAGTLSGGQKRKLSISMALIGGSKVVFLDEPTSGMDPYSRRSTWEMLQNARAGRVLVLTTHFMDEADILGDRVTIMGRGTVRCAGSPNFLKRLYGVGYVLTCVKRPNADSRVVLDIARRFIAEAEITSDVGSELAFRIPLEAAPRLPGLLTEFDAGARFGVDSYALSITNMESVFLQIAREDEAAIEQATALKAGASPSVATPSLASQSSASKHALVDIHDDPPSPPTAGKVPSGASRLAEMRARAQNSSGSAWEVFFAHFMALGQKRLRLAWRDRWGCCCQFGIPVIILLIGMSLLANAVSDSPSFKLDTNVFNVPFAGADPTGPNRVYWADHYIGANQTVDSTGDLPAFAAALTAASPQRASLDSSLRLSGASIAATPDTYGFIRGTSEPQRSLAAVSTVLLNARGNYKETLYGSFIPTSAGTLYPNLTAGVIPSAPAGGAVGYTILHNTSAIHGAPTFVNVINSALYKRTAGSSASISTHTHPLPITYVERVAITSTTSSTVAIIIVIAFSFIPAAVAGFVVRERESGTKAQQLLAGVSIPAYWLTTFTFDNLIYLATALVSIGITAGLGGEAFGMDRHKLGAASAIFLLFGPAVTAFTYLFHFLFKSASSATGTMLLINCACVLLVSVSFLLGALSGGCKADKPLRWIFRFIPSYSLGNGLNQIASLDLLPLLDNVCNPGTGSTRIYDALDSDVAGANIVYLALSGPVYLALTIILDICLTSPRVRSFLEAPPSAVVDAPVVDDEDVVAEKTRVSTTLTSGTTSSAVQVAGLRKVFRTLDGNPKVAVRDLWLGLELGDVFGFLGINGAGKTTTVQMLTGALVPTAGKALLAGLDVETQQSQVRRLVGYCPQFDALFDSLTVKEHLELYARLKGVPAALRPAEVAAAIRDLSLGDFEGKLAGTLSGGNKRKLSVAIATIGRPPLLFLDEPSTGMDPVARRHMWDVIARLAARRDCVVVLITQSMEECEALATRVGIIVGGRLRCLGPTARLKARFGQGLSIEVKLSPPGPVLVQAVATAVMRASAPTAGGGGLFRRDLLRVCEALGSPARAAEVRESGLGWAVEAAFARSSDGSVPVPLFAEWWAREDIAALATQAVSAGLPGASLTERQGATLRFKAPSAPGGSLAGVFETLSAIGAQRGFESFAVGQMSLEDVFLTMAAEQDEEKGVARGFATAGSAGPGKP